MQSVSYPCYFQEKPGMNTSKFRSGSFKEVWTAS